MPIVYFFIDRLIFVFPYMSTSSWMHPRSKHWHLIDYVVVRQRDSRDVTKTCTMGATTCWSDHRMVRSRMRLTFKGSKHRCGTKPRKKLDVARLKSVDIQRQLNNKMDDGIKEQTETTLNVDETWTKLSSLSRCTRCTRHHKTQTP